MELPTDGISVFRILDLTCSFFALYLVKDIIEVGIVSYLLFSPNFPSLLSVQEVVTHFM